MQGLTYPSYKVQSRDALVSITPLGHCLYLSLFRVLLNFSSRANLGELVLKQHSCPSHTSAQKNSCAQVTRSQYSRACCHGFVQDDRTYVASFQEFPAL